MKKLLIISLFFIVSCGAVSKYPLPEIQNQAPSSFVSEKENKSIEYASPEIIEAFEKSHKRSYLLGSGDVLKIEMEPRQEEIVGAYTISPDGSISIFLGGEIKIGGLTLKEAEDKIKDALSKYYYLVALSLRINIYNNNKVFVLGRVESPGAIELTGDGNLLEVLSQAGPLPPVQERAFLSKCVIIRGRDQLIWIDLQELLQNGNISLNLPLNNNDIVYLPDPEDTNVYVMGEVEKPGSYPIKNELSLLSAIGLAGGPTEDAVTTKIQLIRDRGLGGGVVLINLDEMRKSADLSQNYLLKKNDIIFVPKKGFAKVNYYLRQLNPFLDIFFLGRILFP